MAIVVAVVKSRVCRMRRRSRIWRALERDEICLEKDSVESNMKPRFLADRHWRGMKSVWRKTVSSQI